MDRSDLIVHHIVSLILTPLHMGDYTTTIGTRVWIFEYATGAHIYTI